MEIPLFPLRTVLYPGGPLPLRIFEQRYLDMISRCMKEEQPFGVLQIREGTETGPATTYDIGTLARIVDWYQGSDGLLGVTATGLERFRLLSDRRQADGLHLGTVELLPEESTVPLPDELQPLADILEGVIDDLGKLYEGLEKRYDDASWVSYRFAEILPITPEQKQVCLETDDPIERLESMRSVLEAVR
jgi:Lon protease-like protein